MANVSVILHPTRQLDPTISSFIRSRRSSRCHHYVELLHTHVPLLCLESRSCPTGLWTVCFCLQPAHLCYTRDMPTDGCWTGSRWIFAHWPGSPREHQQRQTRRCERSTQCRSGRNQIGRASCRER